MELWEKFFTTGKIEDYLSYSQSKAVDRKEGSEVADYSDSRSNTGFLNR